MNPLKAELVRLIRDEGPIGIARYMGLCLGHPRHGYYMSRDPFGAQGDFTTAPEISQMFGELIGLWAARVWQMMGSPASLRLVELGPGRGTLMADMLRAAKVVPGFAAAIEVHLVETSPVLRGVQALTLAGRCEPVWHETIASALEGPAIVVANEFLDALPLDQFVMTPEGWRERLVGLDGDGGLAFGLSGPVSRALLPPCGGALSGDAESEKPEISAVDRADPARPAIPSPSPPQVGARGSVAAPGSVVEQPIMAMDAVSSIAQHVVAIGGAALFIDYGSVRSGFGDTLQAIKAHRFVDPMAEPGEADLTVHVDFERMGAVALGSGAGVSGPTTQREFLLSLGLAERAQALAAKATPAQANALQAAFDRLTQQGETGMGDLFKVLALSQADLPLLPGFDLHRLPGQG